MIFGYLISARERKKEYGRESKQRSLFLYIRSHLLELLARVASLKKSSLMIYITKCIVCLVLDIRSLQLGRS